MCLFTFFSGFLLLYILNAMESKNKDTMNDLRKSSLENVSCLSSKPAGVVGQLTGSFGNSSANEESSLSSLDGKSIITMLWGLIAFYKGILEAKTTTTDAKSVVAGKNCLPFFENYTAVAK